MMSDGQGMSCCCTDVSHPLQHHCRACGQIFCGKCSSKYSTIPKFGIEKEVRVCEPCYEHLNKSVPSVVFLCLQPLGLRGERPGVEPPSCKAEQGLPWLCRLGWAPFPPGNGVYNCDAAQSWGSRAEEAAFSLHCRPFLTAGKLRVKLLPPLNCPLST